MGLVKWICKRFGCTSSCVYNADAMVDAGKLMETRLSDFQLSVKKFQKVIKILNDCDVKADKKSIITTTTHTEI